MSSSTVTPGYNPKFIGTHFSSEELSIIQILSRDWYITSGGGEIILGVASKYKYILMKPVASFQELFNIEREIVVIFSEYTSFEPRTLDAFEKAIANHQELRIEKVCFMLVSKDSKVEAKMRQLLKADAEYQVVVPFTYDELLTNKDSYFIKNRFKAHFYSRDLFAFQSALKRDIYFFGRADIIHKIVNRHRSNENSGLFGLRKTGKTSIIFGIQRSLKNNNGLSVFLDCQNPNMHVKPWYKVLKLIIDEIKSQNNITVILKSDSEYTEEGASMAFEKDILKLNKKAQKSILLIFDEIEHVSPGVSLSTHWRAGNDFILLWQTLRSLFQKYSDLFSYLIVGTNPKCIEMPMINGIDNPIFNQLPYDYIQPFDVPQTREMVRKIGRIMGLNFDETIYSKLTEDFGGHPFLMRNVCSVINNILLGERPVRVDKSIYEQAKVIFDRDYSNYYEMIVSVLREYYNDEFEMLKFLALGDLNTFNEFAQHSSEYTNHLLGYNILDRNKDLYFFKVESLKNYLVSKNKYKKIKLTTEEKYREISERRNTIEPKLRQITRMILISKYGESMAKSHVLDIMGAPRKAKYYTYSIKDVFHPNKSEIYLEDMKKVIGKHWDAFEHIFGRDKEGFTNCMVAINKYRVEAHAKDISDEELGYFRVCATKLEEYLDAYL